MHTGDLSPLARRWRAVWEVGERIAVIGAGPAGLAYASLVAAGNTVTVFEKDTNPGGAFRYAGLAPMFQEVEARPESLMRHIGDMVAACRQKHVAFRFATDVTREPALLAPFNRIVVATGAVEDTVPDIAAARRALDAAQRNTTVELETKYQNQVEAERKARTRRLIEAGGIIDKAGLLELDPNALYGALLGLAVGDAAAVAAAP